MSPARRRPGIFERHTPPSPSPTFLFDASGVPDPFVAYSLRRLSTSYTGPAIRVQSADNRFADIGFTTAGALDTVALAAFANGQACYITTWYDQSGNGFNLTQSTLVNMPRIYSGTAVETKNGKPSARFLDQRRGMVTGTFPAYSGSTVTAFAVAALPNGATDLAPRFVSLISAAGTDGDVGGSILLGRAGGGTFTQQWAIVRTSTPRLVYNGVYGQLSQITAQINEPNYALTVDGVGATTAVPLGAFNFTRIGVGMSSATNTQAGVDQYVSEVIVLTTTPTTSQQTTVQSNQKAFFATPTGTPPVTPPPPSGQPSFAGTLILKEDFEHGIYDKSHFWTITGGTATLNGMSWNSNTGLVTWPDTNGQNALMIGCRKNASAVNGKEGGYVAWPGTSPTTDQSASRRGAVWVWEQQLPTPSTGYGMVPLLWPIRNNNGRWQDAPWPQFGEIDFPETYSGDGTKQSSGELNIHYNSTGGSTDQPLHAGNIHADLSVRHQCAIVWDPGSDAAGTGCYIDVYLNGVRKFHVTDPRFVPHGTWSTLMNLRLQTEGYGRTPAQTIDGTVWWKIFNLAIYNLP